MLRTGLLCFLLLLAAGVQSGEPKRGAGPFSSERFIRQAALDAATDLEMARLAQSRSGDPAVKEFAGVEIDQRQKLIDQLQRLGGASGVDIHRDADREGRAAVRALGSRKGMDFDRRYVLTVMKNLDRDLRVFRRASRDAKDPQLKAFATGQVPLLELHLEKLRKAVDGSKIGSTKAPEVKTPEKAPEPAPN